jgi:hypothetical protein
MGARCPERQLPIEIAKATTQREEIRRWRVFAKIDVSNGLGGSEMAKAQERTQRRHVREKAIIDHLVQDVYEPKAPDEKHTSRSPTTSTGLLVQDQVRKEWDPRKGGLPTFCR